MSPTRVLGPLRRVATVPPAVQVVALGAFVNHLGSRQVTLAAAPAATWLTVAGPAVAAALLIRTIPAPVGTDPARTPLTPTRRSPS